MFKITTKPIVAIIGSNSIDSVNFNYFINKKEIAQIVGGGAQGVDLAVIEWAIQNRIDYVEFKPNYKIFGEKALLERDKDIIKYCDIIHSFWDGKSAETLFTMQYATKLERPIYLHLIEERD